MLLSGGLGDQKGQMPMLSLLAFAGPWRALGEGRKSCMLPCGLTSFQFQLSHAFARSQLCCFSFFSGILLEPRSAFPEGRAQGSTVRGCGNVLPMCCAGWAVLRGGVSLSSLKIYGMQTRDADVVNCTTAQLSRAEHSSRDQL